MSYWWTSIGDIQKRIEINNQNQKAMQANKSMQMHQLVCLLFIGFCVGCSSAKKATGIPTFLNGSWTPIKQEIGGTPLPKAVFEKQKLVISDSIYTLTAESVDKGILKVSDNKMDIYGREGINKGKHFAAIYKMENGELTICYNLSGLSYPETYETKGKPLFFLSVFKKD
jgi:uncharacterized protein (TIGR03067 family)